MKIAYLYYDFLNLYGESGNIKIIDNVLKSNKIKHEILYLSLDDELDFDSYDLVYIGSGTEENQKIALKHLMNYQEDIKKYMAFQTIGFDKLNQLAHVLFFKTPDGIRQHMKKHAEMLRPRFRAVLDILDEELTGLCQWTEPQGGYFIGIDLPYNTAKRAVSLAKEAGVVMTGAGATFPYNYDPNESNVRIARTYPSIDELKTAMRVFCCCVKLAWAEKIIKA